MNTAPAAWHGALSMPPISWVLHDGSDSPQRHGWPWTLTEIYHELCSLYPIVYCEMSVGFDAISNSFGTVFL